MVRGIGPFDSDDVFLDLSFLEVSVRARSAADEEQTARREVEENRRLAAPRLYTSLQDGVDLSFVLGYAESWQALQEELRTHGEVRIRDLPVRRQEHWRQRLGSAAERPVPAVGEAVRRPQPLVRQFDPPRPRTIPPPSKSSAD
jgi:hypothetical protein